MKRLIVFNKWFLIFIAITIVTLSCVIFYIQTQHFSQFITTSLKESLNDDSLQEVEFDRIQLGLLPPSFKVVNVSLSLADKDKDINAVFDEIALDFSISGVFNRKIAITKLKIERGSIAVRSKESKAEKSPVHIPTLKEIVRIIKKKIPIRFSSVGIYKTDINFQELVIGYIDKIELYRGLEDIELSLQASEFVHRDLAEIKLNQVRSEVVINENEIKINSFQGVVDDQKITADGAIQSPFQSLKRITDLNVSGDFNLNTLNKFKQVEKVGHFNSGDIKYSAKVTNRPGRQVNAHISLDAKKIDCDYVVARELKASIEVKNDSLVIREARVNQDKGYIKLERPFELYSMKKKSFVDDIVDVEALDFPLDSALRYLHPTLKPLQANISGPVSFSLFNSRHFEFKTGNNARAQNLKLVYDKQNILKLDWLEVGGMLFVYKDSKFYLEGEAIGPNSLIQVNGEVSSDKVLFQMPQARIELEDLGGVAGFDLKGNGIFDIEIGNEPGEDILLKVKGNSENTFFEGNQLSSISTDLEYNFDNYILSFKQFDGVIDEYDYKFFGDIFLDQKRLDLIFQTSDIGFTALRKLAKELVFSDLPISLDFISGRLAGQVVVAGTIGNILIDGDITDADFWIGGEYLSNIKTKFNKRADIIKVFETSADVAGGSITVGGNYLLDKSIYDNFLIKVQRIQASRLSLLDDPRLKFTSLLDGELLLFASSNNKKEQEGKLDLSFSETRTLNRQFSNSFVKANLIKEKLILEGEFLDSFYIDSILNFNKEKSLLSFKSKTDELGSLFTFLGVDPNLVSLRGDIDFELLSKFDVSNLAKIDLEASLHSFSLKRDDFYLSSTNKKPIFQVKNGIIKKANVELVGNESLILIKGQGDFNKSYSFSNIGKLNTKVFEFFRDYWISSSGSLNWNVDLSGSQTKFNHRMELKSDEWKVGFVDLPINPESIEIDILEENQNITVKKFNLITPNGNIKTSGDIRIVELFPEINLTTLVQNVRASVARDSYLDLSGDLSLTSKSFPFLLQGNLNILNGVLGQDFINKMTSGEEDISIPGQYLPNKKVSGDFDILEMGIKVQSLKPLVLKNTWLNIPLNILLRFEGSEIAPLVDGRIYSNPLEGRFVLKDQSYVIKKAEVNFSGSSDYKNPLIDLEAESNISNYLINSRVVGTVSNYSVVLNSSPPLESSDILSLVTFGYTQNATQDVGEQSRESLTSVGVGSLLLDQLKIKSLLKDSFGLTLAVTSQEQEVNTGFLDSRNGGDSIVDGRTQTTTRLQVTKKLSQEFDIVMSRDLSSDYQGLNLNYQIKPGVTARGIIEQQNNLEIVEGSNNDTAIGVDIGFKWTFE